MIFYNLLNPANGALNAILVQLHLVNQAIDFTGSRWLGMMTIVPGSAYGASWGST